MNKKSTLNHLMAAAAIAGLVAGVSAPKLALADHHGKKHDDGAEKNHECKEKGHDCKEKKDSCGGSEGCKGKKKK